MILRVRHIFLAAIVALLALVGCDNIGPEVPEVGSGGGPKDASLQIVVGAAPVGDGRAIGSAGSAMAGEKMNNLTVLVTKDNVVYKSLVMDEDNAEFNAERTEALVSFDNMERGTHDIFLVANTPIDLSSYTVHGANVSGLREVLLSELSGTATPAFTEENGMPMTAIITTTLKQGANLVSGELERVVGRLTLVVNNHVTDSNYKVFLTNLTTSPFNASKAYLFNHDYTVPSGNTYRNFSLPSTTQLITNDATTVLFDDYIYETDEAALYNLGFAIGVVTNHSGSYPTYSATTAINEALNHTEIVAGHHYVLYNRGVGMYLCVNDSGVLEWRAANSITAANKNDFLWEFTGNSTSTIRNVGQDLYLRSNNSAISVVAAASATTFTIGNNSGRTFYTSSGSWRRTYYFVNANTSGLSVTNRGTSSSPNSNNQRWYLREISEKAAWSGVASEDLKGSYVHDKAMTYINALGGVSPLMRIDRNEHFRLGVNIFYNPQLGSFNFEVQPWGSGGGDVTFD